MENIFKEYLGRTERIREHIGRVKGVMFRHNVVYVRNKGTIYRDNVDLETAKRVVDTANSLDPLDGVKTEMYKPLGHFKEALPYERAAENVALRKVKEEQELDSIFRRSTLRKVN